MRFALSLPIARGTHDDCLVTARTRALELCALALVHVGYAPTYIRLINLNLAREFVEVDNFQSVANPVQHEPCGFLSNVQGAGQLARTDSVLGIHDQPDRREPFTKADR